MKEVEVRAQLDKSILQLNKKDRYLMENDLNERCIAARLAMYLQNIFSKYDVDVEYNRDGVTPKRLQLPDECANFRDLDGYSLVVPDIIIHKRGPVGPNLLVIEIKKTTNPEGTDCDQKRVPAFMSTLGYLYGALVLCETKPNKVHVAAVSMWLPEH